MLQSINGGESWNPLGTRPANVEMLTSSGETLFALSGNDGILRSTDEGQTWQQINTGIDKLLITALLKHDETLYVATNFGGVFYSKDVGQSWIPMNAGLENRNLMTLAVLNGNLYAGCLADSDKRSAPPGVLLSVWHKIVTIFPIANYSVTCEGYQWLKTSSY
jgi:photosystem II stability/assembly factor-like uncharacterized protein